MGFQRCERDTRFRPAAEDRVRAALLEQTPGACDEAAETFPVMTVSLQQAPPAEPGYVPANRDQSAEPRLDTLPAVNADLFAGRQQRSGRCGHARSQSRRE